jgi:hypothetical protein
MRWRQSSETTEIDELRKFLEIALDAFPETVHNSASLLLTNKTIRWRSGSR